MAKLGIALLLTALLAACTAPSTSSPSVTPSPTPTDPPTPTATPRPTFTPDTIPEQIRPTLTAQASATPTATARPTPAAIPLHPGATPTTTAVSTPAAQRQETQETSCVSDTSPRFTYAHTDLSKVSFITPMIVPSGAWLKNRSYFAIPREPGTIRGYEVPVIAPVDSTLVGVTKYISVGPDANGTVVEMEELDLVFTVSCEVSYGFDHVARLVGAAGEVEPETAVRDTRNAQQRVRVELKAGDLIGYTRGTVAAHTWDFIVTNTTSQIRYANQERYETMGDLARLRDAACPFDYYDEPIRSQYLELLGGWGEGAVGGDDCLGSPDVPGTVAGGWFASPWNPGDTRHVADWGAVVVYGADGTIEVNDGRTMVRTRAGTATHVHPAQVTGEHCYQGSSQTTYAYLNLIDPTTMAIAMGDGACPASLPTNHTVVYR